MREQATKLAGCLSTEQLAEASRAVTLSCELLNLSRIISRGASAFSGVINRVRPLLWPAVVLHAVLMLLLARFWHHSKLPFAALALIPVVLLAQNPSLTPHSSGQAELFKAEEWVLSQGAVESIAPELAAILGVGSDRLPVKLKSYRTSDGISLAFAVSTNPKQEGIVLSALKTIADKMKIYSVGTAWLTDGSGTLRRTIAVDASGARVLPDSSRAADFKNIKAFFLKKLQATSASNTSSPSPRISATAAEGKKGTK